MEQTIAFPNTSDTDREKDIASLHPFSVFNSSTGRPKEAAIIVAMGDDRAIGRAGTMPWHLPADLRHFKRLTMGHPVIMGRNTWLSLPKGALPGRRNIVVSTDPDFSPEGGERASSPEEALVMCASDPMPFILGGGRLYKAMLPMASRMYITRVEATFPDADTFFPEFDPEEWRPDESFEEEAGCHEGLNYRFTALRRKP